jgi:hypothetical protein
MKLLWLYTLLAPAGWGYCHTVGYPAGVLLQSKVLQIQDAGIGPGWQTVGAQRDAQLWHWLIWSTQPGGQTCEIRLESVASNTCGERLDVQFRRETPYNVGILASDASNYPPASSPYSCSAVLEFRLWDAAGIQDPPLNPGDPLPPVRPDSGFGLMVEIKLNVTAETLANPGGPSLRPPGVGPGGTVIPYPPGYVPSCLDCPPYVNQTLFSINGGTRSVMPSKITSKQRLALVMGQVRRKAAR